QFLEKDSRLSTSARAETDQLDLRTQRFRHFRAVQAQNLDLRARDVVLGQIANLLEQLSTLLIVKKLVGQASRRFRETGEDFVAKNFFRELGSDGRVFFVHERSRAKRIPVNCHRLSG